MRKSVSFLFVLIFLVPFLTVKVNTASATTPDSWTTKSPMPTARAYLGVSAVNGKIYAIGGTPSSDIGSASTGATLTAEELNTTEMYDPSLNSWTLRSPMPTARVYFGTAAYQNMIFCIGGYVGSTDYQYHDVGANEAYNTVTDSWVTKESLPTPRFAAATNMVDGRIYVMGGRPMPDFGSSLSVNEVYDPQTNTWTTKTPSPLPVVSSASTVVDNKIYVLGEDTKRLGYNVLEEYDPAIDSWGVKETAINHAWFLLTAAATEGIKAPKRIYFFGESATYVYNPYADYLTSGTPAPTPRLIASVAVVNDAFYLIGGRTGQWGAITFAYPSILNEQYTPFLYGTPEPSPFPRPTPKSTPTQSPSPTPSHSLEPTPPASLEPTPTAEPFPTLIVAVTITVVAVVAVSVLVYFKKLKRQSLV
jgi:N-acetylneuraminic acid mutarotase